MAKPLLCLLRVHKWQSRKTDDGAAYLQCARCGMEGEPPEPVTGFGSV